MKYALATLIFFFAYSAFATPVIDFSEDHSADFNDSLYVIQENQLLSQLYPKFARDFNTCVDGAELIEDGVKVVRGSFSAKGRDEIVIAFMSSACPGSHAGQHGNLALFREMKFVDARNDLSSYQFEKNLDLDGDGASELIVSALGGNQGYFETEAQTITFKGGHIRVLDYISGIVHVENCGAKEDDSGTDIDAVFFPDKAHPGRTIQKNYIKKCSADKSGYKFYSDGPLKGI